MSPYNYSHLRPPTKSKAPFYTTSPHWNDITPIPLLEYDPSKPDPGPALATIAYSERYLEAMSYLRAVMARNESSERVLALTEDVIGMNPAHYTVWGFRMRSLRGMWGVGEYEGRGKVEENVDEGGEEGRVRDGVERELEWLEGISERNLKNYQIWHHRQQLITLLPLPTAPTQIKSTTTFLHTTEIPFLTHILSFDAKNYHVWTYRQWLCRRYPTFLLYASTQTRTQDSDNEPEVEDDGKASEVTEMGKLIEEDVRNNSAWSHRYFAVFGYEELAFLESDSNLSSSEPLIRKDLFCRRNGGTRTNEQGNFFEVDEDVRRREVNYAKGMIERTPQNMSPWNYLEGVLKRCNIPKSMFKSFCESFVRGRSGGITGTSTGRDDAGDEDDELDFLGDAVRSSHAIAWLAEIYASEGTGGCKAKARRCWEALSEKWDPIRKNYWMFRVKAMEEGREAVGLQG